MAQDQLQPDQAAEGADQRVTTVNTQSQSYGALVWRRFRKPRPG